MEPILTLINSGESERIEFKQSFNKEVIETVVAFANAKGGKVFIGIDDSAKIIGSTVGVESIQNHINTIKQNTQPNIIVDINKFIVEEKAVLIIDVQEQLIKPIAYKNRYFKRINNSNHLMSLSEIANEHLKTVNESWDCHIDTRHDFDDISIDKAIKLIEKIEHYQEKEFNDDIFSTLRKYELIKNEQLTFGAYLLFVDNISSLTGMQIGRFKTETMIIDSLNLNTDVLTEVVETMTFIRKNLMVEYIITGEPQRIERYDYPLEAIREIVTNMIVHRDYRDSGDSIIKIFDDHITFFNPGKLYDDLTVEKLQSGDYSSRSRNKALAKMFKEVGSIEKYGSGIARIKQECRNHGILEPIFEEFQHGFKVSLFKQERGGANGGANGGVNGGVNSIYEIIQQTPKLKAKQISDALNIPLRTVERELKKLKDQEKTHFKGATKTGGYYVK